MRPLKTPKIEFITGRATDLENLTAIERLKQLTELESWLIKRFGNGIGKWPENHSNVIAYKWLHYKQDIYEFMLS